MFPYFSCVLDLFNFAAALVVDMEGCEFNARLVCRDKDLRSLSVCPQESLSSFFAGVFATLAVAVCVQFFKFARKFKAERANLDAAGQARDAPQSDAADAADAADKQQDAALEE